MQTYTIFFKPVSRLATWPLSSDLLAGAVCWGIRTLGLMSKSQLTAWLEAQLESPRFAISHAFPVYFHSGRSVRFFPRPVNLHPSSNDFEIVATQHANKEDIPFRTVKIQLVGQAKKVKKIRYVTEAVLNRITAGDFTDQDVLRASDQPGESVGLACGAFCSPEELKILARHKTLIDTQHVQHNHVDRVAGATVEGALFFKNEISFSPQSGLWALLRADPDDVEKLLIPSLRYLSDSGLGADRTTGQGFFRINVEPCMSVPASAQPKAMMTLSHYLPAAGELDLDSVPLAYSLLTLRPKREQRFPSTVVTSSGSRPIYKQAVRMFAPGSVFPLKHTKEIYGRWTRLTPPDDEPVFQSGATVMIPL